MEGFPWDDLRKILPGCRQVTIVLNGAETLPKISIGWVGCTNVTQQTDRRQTDGRRHIANVNMSSRSLKTRKTTHVYCLAFLLRQNCPLKSLFTDVSLVVLPSWIRFSFTASVNLLSDISDRRINVHFRLRKAAKNRTTRQVEQLRSIVASGGARVFAARGKQTSLLPPPPPQSDLQLIFLWLQWWHCVDCEQNIAPLSPLFNHSVLFRLTIFC